MTSCAYMNNVQVLVFMRSRCRLGGGDPCLVCCTRVTTYHAARVHFISARETVVFSRLAAITISYCTTTAHPQTRLQFVNVRTGMRKHRVFASSRVADKKVHHLKGV